MSQVSGIREEKDILKGKPTLVRRVSDMFKDGTYSGPPMLFRHASMQKIRHCCQNLNLLPYLLYSFDNSKSHPLARQAHVYLSHFLHDVIVSILIAYENLRQSVVNKFLRKTPNAQIKKTTSAEANSDNFTAKFGSLKKPKRKEHPLFLIAAVYLVPLLLVFQVGTLCGLTIISKFCPGFIFLISSLLFLGSIKLKILLHGTIRYNINRCGRKERKKVE